MATETAAQAVSPVGRRATEAAGGRRRRSGAYRNARDEYAAIAELRESSPLAAHLRERRFELEMTQVQVAKLAKTTDKYISKLESGHLPTLGVLQRVLAVLDEDLILVFEERGSSDDQQPAREEVRVPAMAA